MIFKKEKTTEAIICRNCKGFEKVKQTTADDNYIMITCPTCLGSGRELVTITKKYKPFKITKHGNIW